MGRHKKLRVGDTFHHDIYGTYEVVSYNGSLDVEVIFLNTGWRYTTSSGSIRKGLVKNYLIPTVVGVGYNSLGKLPKKG